MFEEKELQAIAEKRGQYEAAVEKALAKNPEMRKEFTTGGGIPLKRVYTPEDVKDLDYNRDLGFPGAFPYTRGVQPTMYRGRFWTMRQYAGFATAEESNARYRYLLSQGTTGLSVAFDLPTQIGYDSDHPMAQGEVGKVGVAIDSLADMEILFDQIPLDKVSTSMTINAPASVLLAMYIAVGEKQGVPSTELSGTIQNDILKEYIARGTYIFPPKPSMRLITDIFEFCSTHVPKWNTISISGYHIREAGSTAIQEVAFTLADGIAYVEAAVKKGQDPNVFGKRLSFFFNAHNDFLEEVAKFRAARRLWAKIMRDRFGVTDKSAQMLRFHTQTAGSTLTAQQPETNIVRVAIKTLAAVLGGTQSLHTNSLDEALALPTEESLKIAVRTQQILAEESGVSYVTLAKWREEARSGGEAAPGNGEQPERWSSEDKFLIVLETHPLNAAELGEYCRSKGIFPEEIEAWREACLQANRRDLLKRQELQKEIRSEKKRSKALEKELLRKERALAETAALLTLRKKAQAIWGEDEAD